MYSIRSILLTLVLAIVMFSGVTISTYADSRIGNDFKISEKNFETPEAAIRHFTERLAANDLMGAFEACAINEADKFDFIAYSRWINAMLLIQSDAPSQSPVFAQINCVKKMSFLAQQVKIMMYSILTDEKIDGKTIFQPGDDRIEQFAKNADSRRLAGLKVVKIELPISAEILNSERARTYALREAKIYGADDMTEKIVVYQLGPNYFVGGMHLLKYGKYWRIVSLNSTYANMSVVGNVVRIPPEELDKIGKE
jgi:hypothetical protein